MHTRHKDRTNKVRLRTAILSPKCRDFNEKRFIGVYAKEINRNMGMVTVACIPCIFSETMVVFVCAFINSGNISYTLSGEETDVDKKAGML